MRRVIPLALGLLLTLSNLNAATNLLWNGGGADERFTTGANWAGGVAPNFTYANSVPGDSLFFGGSTRLTPSNDVASVNQTAASVTFAADAGPFVVLGNKFVLGYAIGSYAYGGNITNLSANPQTFVCDISSRAGSIVALSNDLIFRGAYDLGINVAGRTNIFDGPFDTHLVGKLSDRATLIKAGSGSLFLESAANTFSGPLWVNSGALAFAGSGALPNAPFINLAAGVLLDLTGLTNGPFVVGATQVVSGVGTVVGAMTVNGTLSPGASNSPIGILTFSNAALIISNTLALDINGTNAGVDCDQLLLTGGSSSLLLAGANLVLTGAPNLAPGSTVTIIHNTNSHPTLGTFFGLLEGKLFAAAGNWWRISYTNNANRDVTLTAVMPMGGDFYWDTATTSGLQPGNGFWSGTNAVWSASASGSNPLLAWPAGGSNAIFAGADGAYTVTVVGTQNVNTISFANDGYTITGGRLQHAAGPMIFHVNGDATLTTPVDVGEDFYKDGSARLSVNAPIQCTGPVSLLEGTLALGANNLLSAGNPLILGDPSGTLAGLDCTKGSQTVAALSVVSDNPEPNTIAIGAGQALTITGNTVIGPDTNLTGGTYDTALSVSGPGALMVNANNGSLQIGGYTNAAFNCGDRATLDLVGLNFFNLNLGANGAVQIGDASGGLDSDSESALVLATNSVLSGGRLVVGPGGHGAQMQLLLGSGTNYLNFNTNNIGTGSRDSGVVYFGSSNGTVRLRNAAGTGRAILNIGGGTVTTSLPGFNEVDLSGHYADLLVGTLTVGEQARLGGVTNVLTFDQGILDANTLRIGNRPSSTANAPSNFCSIVTLAGGTVNIGTTGIVMAANYGTNGGLNLAALNLLGGAVTVNGPISLLTQNSRANAVQSILTISNAAVSVAGDISVGTPTTSPAPNVAMVDLQSGLLNLKPAGDSTAGSLSANILSLNGVITNALNVTVGTLSGGGAIVNQTGSTLVTNALNIGNDTNPATLTLGPLRLGASAVPAFHLTTSPAIGGGTNDLLQVNGNLNLSNNTVAINALAPLTPGSYRLINYTGTKSGSFNPAVSAFLGRAQVALDETTLHQINLIVSGTAASLVWTGTRTNTWDVQTSTNWLNSVSLSPDVFYPLDSVRFDDTTSVTNVVISTNVYPAAVVVENSARPYAFSGVGGLAGTGALTKNGAGSLILSNQNSYTGSTFINQGVLRLGPGGRIASSPLISLAAGATWDVSLVSGGAALQAGQTLGGNGQVNGAFTVASGATLAPAGNLTVNGSLALKGTTAMRAVKSGAAPSCDSVTSTAKIKIGGLLLLTNLGPAPLAPGDSLQLFNAPVITGMFTNIVPGYPGPGLLWDITALCRSGTLKVIAVPSMSLTLTRSNSVSGLTLNGSTNQLYQLLTSTNVTKPLSQWETVTSGVFSVSPLQLPRSSSGERARFFRDGSRAYTLLQQPLVVASAKTPTSQWINYNTRTLDHLPTALQTRVDTNLSQYGGLLSRRTNATGFFYPLKVDDRWWLIDPDGCYFIHRAVVNISLVNSTGAIAAFQTKFGTTNNWATNATRLVQSNAFNGSGAWCDSTLRSVNPPLVYTPIFNFVDTYARTNNGVGYPYVWDPAFAAFCDRFASNNMSGLKNDPWLLGYFSDNELVFTNILTVALSLPAGNTTGDAAWAWLQARYGAGATTNQVTTQDKNDFLGYTFGQYYSVVSAAIKRHDPNHLYLGSRLHGSDKDRPEIFRALGPYLDVVSFNHYGYWTPDFSKLNMYAQESGRPVLITEFYTKGEDSGLPNTTGAGWVVHTQNERALFYENFILALLESKVIVGWHWFKYADNDPNAKWADPSNIDSNKGIVNNRYEPWTVLLTAMKRINERCYRLIDYFDGTIVE